MNKINKSLVKRKTLKRRKTRRRESYSTYIYKVLKQIHPGMGSKAMSIINTFINHMFERLSKEACSQIQQE